MSSTCIVAVDPGRAKCGVAVLSATGQALHQDIIPTEMVGETVDMLMRQHGARSIVIGRGTAADAVMDRLLEFRERSQIITVAEKNTTLLARQRYWQDHAPGCLTLLLPAGMRIPPRPVDDYAAIIIGERYLHSNGEQ
jgi:RNase H-fold protein (predicted Holliday junction resolvase)